MTQMKIINEQKGKDKGRRMKIYNTRIDICLVNHVFKVQ